VADWRPVLTVATGVAVALSVAACSSTTASRPDRPSPVTVTTQAPVGTTTLTTAAPCASGTVAVPWQPSAATTTACVTVGTTLDLTGGDDMSGGTWPGPPVISDPRVLSLASTTSTGSDVTAGIRAVGAGSATVTVPFVAGSPVCTPTPCTPVPGRPLVWQITVVG